MIAKVGRYAFLFGLGLGAFCVVGGLFIRQPNVALAGLFLIGSVWAAGQGVLRYRTKRPARQFLLASAGLLVIGLFAFSSGSRNIEQTEHSPESPTEAPIATTVQQPTETPQPTLTATPQPTRTPRPTNTARPTDTLEPTATATKPPMKAPPTVTKPAPTNTLPPAPTATQVPLTATPQPVANCDPSYPDDCIPPPPPDLDCGDIPYRRFRVLSPDPHGFDGDNDGIGCER